MRLVDDELLQVLLVLVRELAKVDVRGAAAESVHFDCLSREEVGYRYAMVDANANAIYDLLACTQS